MYRLQAGEAEERAQQCQTQLARERAERDAPRGITGLLALKQMNHEGIHARRITEDVTLRPGEAFTVGKAVSYRATGGEEGAEVTRLAVELRLWNRGTQPWTPTHAQLVGEDQVAQATELYTEVYGRVERAGMMPTVPTLQRICLVLKLDYQSLVDRVMRGEEPPED